MKRWRGIGHVGMRTRRHNEHIWRAGCFYWNWIWVSGGRWIVEDPDSVRPFLARSLRAWSALETLRHRTTDMVNRASIILTEAHLGTGIIIINRVHRDMVFFFFFWRIRLVIIMQKVYRAHEWQNASIVSHWFWQLTDNSHVSDISFAREWTSQDGNDIRKSSNISTMTLYPIHHMPNISIPVPHIHNHMVYTYNDIPLAATIRSTECL